jgi:hypothetical protein
MTNSINNIEMVENSSQRKYTKTYENDPRLVNLNAMYSTDQVMRMQVPSTIQTLKIEVNSATDWPVVAATVFVGIMVAVFSYRAQLIQIRGSIATYRHEWQLQFRMASVEFLTATSEISYKQKNNHLFKTMPESDLVFNKLVTAQRKIILMLDPKKMTVPPMSTIVNKMKDIREALDVDNHAIVSGLIEDFNNQAKDILENAWVDMKTDLRAIGLIERTFIFLKRISKRA